MPEVNLLAVLVAALAAFLIGGLWYGPLFGRIWAREAEVDEERMKETHPAKLFGPAFVLSLVAAYMLALFLGPRPDPGFAIGAGAAAGLFLVGAAFGINYLFARRSMTLFLIDAGYNTLFFAAIGAVLGFWP
jgi:hypothetical protein